VLTCPPSAPRCPPIPRRRPSPPRRSAAALPPGPLRSLPGRACRCRWWYPFPTGARPLKCNAKLSFLKEICARGNSGKVQDDAMRKISSHPRKFTKKGSSRNYLEMDMPSDNLFDSLNNNVMTFVCFTLNMGLTARQWTCECK
jgi:hypothetical protein